MSAHDFIAQIGSRLQHSVAHGLGGGCDAKEKAEFLQLPADWAARLKDIGNGITATQVNDDTLKVTSSCGKWVLWLIVQTTEPMPKGKKG